MKKKTITLDLVGYEIQGIADVTPWGGGNACIEMDPFMLDNPSREGIQKGLNDGGFGVESINGAVCSIYEVYADEMGGRVRRFLKTMKVGKVSAQTMEYEKLR